MFGLNNSGCMDCSGCHPKYFKCQTTDLELLGIEFSKDTEVQNLPYLNYTQEVVYKHYLSKDYDALIINVGTHDMHKMTSTQFKSNIDWMFSLINENQMKNSSALFVWVTIMAIDEQKLPTHEKNINNANVKIFNGIASPLAKKYGFHVFDAYKLSIQPEYITTYEDGVHPSKHFFMKLSKDLKKYLTDQRLRF